MSSKNPLKTIYFIVKDHQISFCSTNFKAVYDSLKQFEDELGLKNLKSYSSCVAIVKNGKSLTLPTKEESIYYVHSMPIHTKAISWQKILHLV